MRRTLIAIGALLALLLAGTIATRMRGGGDVAVPQAAPPGPSLSAAQTAPNAPTATPEQAASAAVALTGQIASAGFIERRELIESVATPRFGPQLAEETSGQITDLQLELSERDQDPADLQTFEQALRARVVSSDEAAATVDVWSVSVVAPPGAATARAMWRTVTIDLVLADGEWLVDGWTSTPGPTPMVGPESSISSSTDVAAVLGWAPAPAPTPASSEID